MTIWQCNYYFHFVGETVLYGQKDLQLLSTHNLSLVLSFCCTSSCGRNTNGRQTLGFCCLAWKAKQSHAVQHDSHRKGVQVGGKKKKAQILVLKWISDSSESPQRNAQGLGGCCWWVGRCHVLKRRKRDGEGRLWGKKAAAWLRRCLHKAARAKLKPRQGSFTSLSKQIFESCYLSVQQPPWLSSLTHYPLIFPAILTLKSFLVSSSLSKKIISACSSPVQVNIFCIIRIFLSVYPLWLKQKICKLHWKSMLEECRWLIIFQRAIHSIQILLWKYFS